MCSLNTRMYRAHIEIEHIFLIEFFLCFSLTLSLLRILREPKLSIKPVSFFLYLVSNTCFRTLLFTNPFATNLGLYFGLVESDVSFSR